jgi:putative two-component system response regulator
VKRSRPDVASARVLLVDDDRELLQAVYRRLGRRFGIDVADGAPAALQAIATRGPYAVVVADMQMPGTTGVELFARMRQLAPDSVRVLMTGMSERHVAIAAINQAGVFAFLEKPCSSDVLADTLDRAIEEYRDRTGKAAVDAKLRSRAAELGQLLSRAHREQQTAVEGILEAWVEALNLRDHETREHSRRVVRSSMRLGKALGFRRDALNDLKRGAMLHDIGKIGVPDRVLLKPGPLTADERSLVQQHPEYARRMLACLSLGPGVLDIPYCHHERWDGSGYPRGLRGEQIPFAARAFAVVDVFDAMISTRPYSTGLAESEVLAYLTDEAGRLFDPVVVTTFVALVQRTPHAFRRLPIAGLTGC